MPTPKPGNLMNWSLSEVEDMRAKILSPEQHAKLQTMNVELAENLAEFTFNQGGDSGVLLNTPDYWQLRGRRSLVLQLLSEHDDAMGQLTTANSADSQESVSTFQPAF